MQVIVRRTTRLGLCLALVAAQLAFAQATVAAAGGAPAGPLIVPDSLGGLELSGVTDFEEDDPGLGWGARYQAGAYYSNAYLYTRGRQSISDGALGDDVKAELANAIGDIEEARRKGSYQAVATERSFDVLEGGQSCFAAQILSLRVDDQFRPSIVAVGGFRSHFVKIRLTWTEAPDDVHQTGAQILQTFCRDLRRLNARVPLPAPGPRFGDVEWGASADLVRQVFPELSPSKDERDTCQAGRGKYVSPPFNTSRCDLALEGYIVYAGARAQATFIFDDGAGLVAVQVHHLPVSVEDEEAAKALFERTGKSLSALYGRPRHFPHEVGDSVRGRVFVWDAGESYCRMTALRAEGHLLLGVLHARREWMNSRP